MIPSGATFDSTHTYRDLSMIPKSKITFDPPRPRYNIEDVAGASGELDYTEMPTGKVHYDSRTGTIDFLVMSGSDYIGAYDSILDFFDGSAMTCVLDDDPGHSYRGRFWVSGWESHEGFSDCQISYMIEPYRYSEDPEQYQEWLWDEMDFNSDEYLFYSEFRVSGQKARTLINPMTRAVSPTVICTGQMTVLMGGTTYHLPAGTTTTPGFVLQPGPNACTFTGTGTVKLLYPGG